MKNFLVYIYGKFPSKLRKALGSFMLLKPLRNAFLRNNGAFRETNVIIERDYENYKLHFNFFSSIQVAAKATKNGVESTLLTSSIKLLKKYRKGSDDLIILDIGSNFGYLSLVWAGSIAKKGKVIAFEPNAKVGRSFEKSIVSNNLEERIILERLAVGNANKEINLYDFNTTSNTLSSFNPNLIETNRSIIKMIKLDDYIKQKQITKIDLIKIDVDGIELDVLKGAEESIRKFRPIIVVELNEEMDIQKFIEKFDYHLLDIRLNDFDSSKPVDNVFCIPSDF